MNSAKGTVFVIDDEPSVRKALTRLLRSAGYPVESFASGEEFLAGGQAHRLGCILLDLRMPGGSGFDLQQALAADGCLLPIIFMSGHGDIPASVRALKAGALDFLPKPFTDEQLLEVVEHALALCKERLQDHAERAEIRQRLARLTPRERQVLEGVVAGKLNKEIAAELGTVEKTVKVHRGRVMQKLEAHSLADLVRLAERNRVQSARASGPPSP